MDAFIAHYCSPRTADVRGIGFFEFESDARLGSKALAHDARIRMLELFGKDAVSWSIDSIQRKTKANACLNGQLEFDFREEKPEKHVFRRQWL